MDSSALTGDGAGRFVCDEAGHEGTMGVLSRCVKQ